MDSNFYYTSPEDQIFEEVKAATILVRLQQDNFNYVYDKEKIDKYKMTENIDGNFMFLIASLDHPSIVSISRILSKKARKEVYDRLVAGGDTTYNIYFLDMKAIDYIVWDLETSGLEPSKDKILEIGCLIKYEDGSIDRKNWILNNNIEIPEEIVKITGITQEIIDNEGRDPGVCLAEFLGFLNIADKNITHNGIKFDIPFLVEYVSNTLGYNEIETIKLYNHLRSRAHDTAVDFKASKIGDGRRDGESYLDFADRVMNTRAYGVKYNLGLVCDENSIDRSNITQHRALGDVELTHMIFKQMVLGEKYE